MVYFLWSLPVLAVLVLVGSGRATSAVAAAVGAALAIAASLLAAPVPVGPADAVGQVARGAWLAWLVVAIILGGPFSKEAVSAPAQATPAAEVPAGIDSRCESACRSPGANSPAPSHRGISHGGPARL